ncbi:MAG: hypothetical protein U0Z44_01600 [Kouleothrix sp.]
MLRSGDTVRLTLLRDTGGEADLSLTLDPFLAIPPPIPGRLLYGAWR